MTRASGYLLVLGCSATKRAAKGELPAIERYDGVNFRVLRKFLLESGWPPGLSIKILSAKFGLIDATDLIETYDERMTSVRAERQRPGVTAALGAVSGLTSVFVNLGQDYRPAVDDGVLARTSQNIVHARGGIGEKMKQMRAWLHRLPVGTATMPRTKGKRPYLYFFPDWDDYVSVPFVGEGEDAVATVRKYAHEIFGAKQTPYDGLLVSLAQLYTGKGALSRLDQIDTENADLRKSMKAPDRLLLFGDCGAFSYVNKDQPPFSAAEAARLYDHFGFDIGASVDHIPLPEIVVPDEKGKLKKRLLTEKEQAARVALTTKNAREFLGAWKTGGYKFVPLGVIQGTTPQSYVECVNQYLDMGYKHIALGGLVPRSDAAILEVCSLVRKAVQSRTRTMRENVWVHLFGILRPKIQPTFRTLGISSFDSASFLRKAWLRSDQNYLSPDGTRWFSTIRIPISGSSRMQDGAKANSITSEDLTKLEVRCLRAVRKYDGSEKAKAKAVKSINAYGPLLERRGEDNHFVEKHNALLTQQPWKKCRCPMCREVGIDVVIFRGAGRNKRRGLHNTWVFYHKILHGKNAPSKNGPTRDCVNQFLPLVRAAVPRFAKHAPNPQQQKCILHDPATPLMIVAGPGSGKTTVLVLRALRLVFVDGLMPEQVLLTTFTRKAADELRARLIEWGLRLKGHLDKHPVKKAGFKEWLDSLDINRFVTGTLDSICEEMLTTFRNPNDPVPVLVEGFVGNGILAQKALFPNSAHSDTDLANYLSAFTIDGGQPQNFGEIIRLSRTILDRFVHDMVDLNSFQAAATHPKGRELLCKIVESYRQFMAEGSRMDFALLEETFFERLKRGRLKRFTDGVKAVLVDEYQDTNPLQEAIYLELIRITKASLTIVGDDDQSLYRFRGATVELFSDFRNRFRKKLSKLPKPVREDLTDNYRSTPEIVQFFNGFITTDGSFQAARVAPPKPKIVANQPTNGVRVLGMFRDGIDDLADGLSEFLLDVFRRGGRAIDGHKIVANSDKGDFGDSVLLSHTVNEFGAQFGPNPPKERLPKQLRDRLAAHNVGVFNPRGRHLRDIPQVQQLLGVVLECIDPRGLVQAQLKLKAEVQRYLGMWRQEGQTFIATNPFPFKPHTLAQFVQAWQKRKSQTGAAWPNEWPFLELCFKVISWLPFFQDDPEGQVYLEAIARCIAQAATFSSYRSNILKGQGPHDESSVKKAIQDILAPIAESAIEVDEEIMPHVPRERLPIMTIHQSKGLEFPLVIVDVSSDCTTNHAKTRFRRFPEISSSVQDMENDFASHCEIGPLRLTRTGLQRSFDDLIRLYYVAYSRPESVLLLVGHVNCLQYRTTIKHVGLGWSSDGNWSWITPVAGKPPSQVNSPAVRLI